MKVKNIVLWCALEVLCGIQFFPLAVTGDEAKELHLKGVKLFEESQFLEAAKAFREAQRLRPSWKLHFNIAQCDASAKRYGLALEAFEAYLVGGGDAVPEERREYVLDEIARIQPLVGRLAINGADADWRIVVDGDLRATTPLSGPVRIEAGTHQIVLLHAGAVMAKQTINIAGGMETSVEVAPTDGSADEEKVSVIENGSAPKSTLAKQVAMSTQGVKKGGPMRPIAWAGLGTGIGAAIAGTITGALALAKSKDLSERCPSKDDCSTGDRDLKEHTDNLALATNVLLPVGGVLTVAGVVLLILNRTRSPEHTQSVGLTLAPVIGPSQAGLNAGGRF